MIEFVNVSQNYGTFRALHNINFKISEGSLLALLGPNGAGKSTAMSIMTGFRPPIEGDVYINGINIFDEPEKAKSFIGYLSEIPPLYPELTVEEYLDFTGRIHGLDWKQSKIQMEESLDFLQIRDRKSTLINNLSKGLKQRVGIAQSIMHKPKVLVLDEPTVGLEPAQLVHFRNLIRMLSQNFDMTIVLSTHIMSEAAELCDQVIIINEGRKIFDGSKEDLLQKQQQELSYQVKVKKISESLINHLKDIKGVLRVVSENGIITISANNDIAETLSEEIIKQGAGLRFFSPVRNTLEEVFLQMTDSESSNQGESDV
ncbi:MAG: ABC transporter ATP-binding protein [Brevinemataceae bacterium]